MRVHRPAGAEGACPAIFTIHGGGYVIGSYDMDDPCTTVGPALGTVGVSVDYRLAPETPYPGPLEDCYAALRWTYEHADELGIDRTRIGIYGISAGGGLAAALALVGPRPGGGSARLPTARLPDARRPPGDAVVRAEGLYVWTAASNEFGWRSYLGDLYGSDDVPPYAAAARATDADRIATDVRRGRIDRRLPRRGRRLRQRLNQAGVRCELYVMAGCRTRTSWRRTPRAVPLATHCKDDWLARQIRQLGVT